MRSPVAEVASKLEAKAASFVKDNRLPGAAVGVVHGDELVWAAGVGCADVATRRAPDRLTLYRIASITKTINLLTGTPYLNQFDAAATSLLGSFTDKPDFTPFTARQPDARVYQPQSAAAARARPGIPGPKSPEMDDPAQMHENLLRMLKAARRLSGR